MENRIEYIISRVISGNASTNDILKLSEWLNADKRNELEFQKLKCYMDAEVSFNHSISPSLAFEKMQQKIRKQKQRRLWQIVLPVAAAVILLLLIPTIYQSNNKEKEQLYTYLSNNNKSEFQLKDGTKVVLNKNSKLTYSEAYGKEKRHVELVGEGYFEVTKNAQKPFEVQVGDASIKVLGTIFNVEAIEDDEYITATLIKGSIRFESPKQQVILSPNQQLRFEKSTQQIDVSTVDTDLEIAWKNDLLKYKSISFVSLLKDLEKRYNVKFTILNKKLTDPAVTLSGTFTQEQSLEQILQVINKSLPIKWSYKEGVYYIK
ncbi:FecR family protein [Parabacteroides gordonii]|nr:FecR domain-containing protein [Parabacteroides gordonii]RGP13101.1 DUF4974 domain-containing protein [Parabacteroides gordonii]